MWTETILQWCKAAGFNFITPIWHGKWTLKFPWVDRLYDQTMQCVYVVFHFGPIAHSLPWSFLCYVAVCYPWPNCFKIRLSYNSLNAQCNFAKQNLTLVTFCCLQRYGGCQWRPVCCLLSSNNRHNKEEKTRPRERQRIHWGRRVSTNSDILSLLNNNTLSWQQVKKIEKIIN